MNAYRLQPITVTFPRKTLIVSVYEMDGEWYPTINGAVQITTESGYNAREVMTRFIENQIFWAEFDDKPAVAAAWQKALDELNASAEHAAEDDALEVEAPAADFDSIKAQITNTATIDQLSALRDTVASATLSDYERNLLLWACDNAIRDIRTVERHAAKQAARKDPAPEQIAWNDAQYTRFILTGE